MANLPVQRIAFETAARDRAAAARGRFWRSIAEAEGRVEPRGDWQVDAGGGPFSRRAFMKVMGASLALAGTAGCSPSPLESIVPYRQGPAQQTYGKPVFYASTLPHDGYGLGVLVETNMGRPTKIEGNPQHPASLGATDVFRQAAVLSLWDPDRSRTARRGTTIVTWNDFLAAVQPRLAAGNRSGRRVRLLTHSVASPSLHAGIQDFLARYPGARWHQWQPVNQDHARAGAMLAYGRPLDTLFRFDRAAVVLAVDGDFLDDHPGFVRYALDFSATRRVHDDAAVRSRLYALECTPTLTGAAADHRFALRASAMEAALREIAAAVGIGDASGPPVLGADRVRAIAADLQSHGGASIVAVGRRQPARVHALAHALNERLGNLGKTVVHIPPVAAESVDHTESLAELVAAMRAGEVDTLLMTGVNPVYTAPADLSFVTALAKVPFKAHHGLYLDETALRCDWHLPAAHPLESWGDLASFDGATSLQQPAIAPLYGGTTAHEFVAACAGNLAADARELLRAYWHRRRPGDLDAFFETALREGVADQAAGLARTALRPEAVTPATDPARGSSSADELELVFAPDPRIGDGAYANNAWLQELPKPLSMLTWDNAALLSPALAARLDIASGDVISLTLDGRSVEAPAWIMPGMPDGSVTLALGYGRNAAGGIGNRGANAYLLRTSTAPWFARGLAVKRTGRRRTLACVQTHHSMEGRDIVRTFTADEAEKCTAEACGTPHFRDERTLYDSPPTGPYAWAMSVDLSACIGCGACTIACQAENNIPVVGPDEVERGREMHWIRVDRYYEGPVDDPRTLFQPVPCMQCEHAPCEPVCPVEASVHDAQGINVQVYNRCVGTRFCSNNCPYKVRRFNFLQYSDRDPQRKAQRNPEVTVRMRGVMEKCNYCLQRITTAKIDADRESRRLADGEVITACQAVCPTRAIVFGDLNLPGSEVRRRKSSPLDYALLAELNTRPRTTYLARVTNPSAALPATIRRGDEHGP